MIDSCESINNYHQTNINKLVRSNCLAVTTTLYIHFNCDYFYRFEEIHLHAVLVKLFHVPSTMLDFASFQR